MGANFLHFFLLSLSLLIIFSYHQTSSSTTPQSYVVYMGGPKGESDIKVAESNHLELLKTVIPSDEGERISVNHVYHHALRGFSAVLTDTQASLLSGHEDVISVFRDPSLKLHTTRSWDFLDQQSGFKSKFHYQHGSTDVIIGVIDTGIWPESPSFSDKGIGNIPQRWKGECMESSDFKTSNCNRKIIGARHYGKGSSVRDSIGHGTHTASTAAGIIVSNASYYGLAQGTARGGLPSARIAVYKPCNTEGCSGSNLLKAIDDAVKDGVDIISISIGSEEEPDFLKNPIAIGSFHANQLGILVVCSVGNSGPDPYTAVNTAPWIFTVAASTIDRAFQSTLLLGNKATFKGSGITLSNLTSSPQYPLVFARDVAAKSSTPSEASNCFPWSLNSKKVAGKLVVCLNNDRSITKRIKMTVAEEAGARGLILISDVGKSIIPFDSGAFPFTQVGKNDGIQILNYINSTKKPTATIFSTTTVERFKPAPIVADFSSRGPGRVTENILKPDIMAPGVAILAAVPPTEDPKNDGIKASKFGLRSGTSMACPHVSGAAAFIKSIHYRWTPSMIKSSLMTTATNDDNAMRFLRNSRGYIGNPHQVGAGEISPERALHPGLVFPTTTQDYLHLLCFSGYSMKQIKSISSISAYECPKLCKKMLISEMNYPSISIGKLKRSHGRKITRHVINVGSPNSTYVSSVHSPGGLRVQVLPPNFTFHHLSQTASFNVYIRGKQANKGYNYGFITFSDGKHFVRMVFAINIVD